MVLRKLAISNFTNRKVRVALTVAAVALSVSLVVSVTGGLRSGKEAAYEFLAFVFGSTDAQVTRAMDPRKGIDAALVGELRSDPDVRRAWARLETESIVLGPDGKPVPGRPLALFGIAASEDDAARRLKVIDGRWFVDGESDVAVIDQGTRDRLKVKPGDTLTFPGTDEKLELRIVGVVHKPGIIASYLQSAYVPLDTLQTFVYEAGERRVSKINVEFEADVDAALFVSRWSERLRSVDPLLKVTLTRDARVEMDENLQGLTMLSYLGGAVTMLAATFIVFSTLAMGVAERQRTLAMLRAIGAARGQIGRLVVLEGFVLSALGVAIGVPLGWLWVWILTKWFDNVFTAGVVLDPIGMGLASVGSMLAAVLASLLPAWNAMRVDPLSAMTPLAVPPSRRAPLEWAALGLALISIDPILLFAPIDAWLHAIGLDAVAAWERDIRFWGHFIVGLPGVMLGFFLLAPLFVWTVERALAPLVAAALGIRYGLLRQQLSSGGVWRPAGTCAALMVGLATLVVMQTQGHTALSGWKLPDRFPDAFVYTTNLRGLDPAAQQAIRSAEGVKGDETMPIAIFSPTLVGQFTGIAGAAIMPDATMFFGVDPDKAFDLMELDFREGTPEEATRLLKQGRHIVITEEFRKLKGLGVGDQFELVSATKGQLSYTIAGVVWSPGMDVMASAFDMGRQLEQRTAASVFGSLEDARRDFGVENVYLMAANLELGVDKKAVIERLHAELGDKGINVADVRALKYEIQQGLRRLLLMSSTVAWAALAVASLGVTNTIMASVRSRRWHLGILRSIGVTRWGLARMIFGEALLLGIVGCALGLAAGVLMAIDARQISELVIGYAPPVAVPWGIISVGVGVVMLIAIGASLWPAIHVARAEPLSLLQAGRASA